MGRNGSSDRGALPGGLPGWPSANGAAGAAKLPGVGAELWEGESSGPHPRAARHRKATALHRSGRSSRTYSASCSVPCTQRPSTQAYRPGSAGQRARAARSSGFFGPTWEGERQGGASGEPALAWGRSQLLHYPSLESELRQAHQTVNQVRAPRRPLLGTGAPPLRTHQRGSSLMNLSAGVVHHGTAGARKASLEKQDLHLAKRQMWTWKPAKDVRGHAESEARPGLKGLDHWPLSRPSVLLEDSL